MKSQIENNKSQINSKFQYSITKTWSPGVSQNFATSGLPEIIKLGLLIDNLFRILNLGNWDLFEICYLVLGFLFDGN
jgi:hypothetical protein